MNHFSGLNTDQIEYDILNVGNLFPYEFNVSYFQTRDYKQNYELFKKGGQYGYLKFDELKAQDKMIFFEDSIVKSYKALKIPECDFFKYNDALDQPKPQDLKKLAQTRNFCPMAFQWLDESTFSATNAPV